MTREHLITITRQSIQSMDDVMWMDLNRYPNHWQRHSDAWRDVVTWIIPEQDWLLLVLKWPELLDLQEI